MDDIGSVSFFSLYFIIRTYYLYRDFSLDLRVYAGIG